MKKIFMFFIVCVMAMALLLSACQKSADNTATTTEPTSSSSATETTAPEYQFYTLASTQKADDGQSLNVVFKYKENESEKIIYHAMVQVMKKTQNADGSLSTKSQTSMAYNLPLKNDAFDKPFPEGAPKVTGKIVGKEIKGTITYKGKKYDYTANKETAAQCPDCMGTGTEIGGDPSSGPKSCSKCNGMGVVLD